MIKMTIQDTEETAEFKVLEKPIIQKPLIAESDVVTIDNNLSTYVTGTQKRELTVGLGYLDSIGYETLRRIRDRQYAVLKYPTVTITADEPVDMGYGEDVPDYRQRLVQLKGKNLFDKNNTNQIIDDVYINTTDNILDASGGAGTGTIYISCSPQTTYTISKIVSSRFRVGTTSGKPVAGVSVSGIITNDSATKITITTGDNAKYLCVYYRRSQSDSVTKQQLLDSIQIELGSTSTTYEPYTDIELCKIGDYQDYIHKSGDKWYVHKETGGIVLDGNTTQFSDRYTAANSKYRFVYADNTIPNFVSGTVAEIYCDRLIGGTIGDTWNGRERIAYNDAANRLIMYINDLQTSSLADANTWLRSNNISIKYILATPTEIEITNATLKAQLNALQNSAFDRWTKVETNVQEPSLQPYLTVTQGEITGSGKEVMLEGTTEDLLDFVILGDTLQQTYSGKNLFPPDDLSDSQGIKWIVQNNEIIGSGTARNTWSNVDSWVDTVFPAGTYTISFSNSRTVKLTLRLQDANGTNHVIEVDTDTTKTFTTTWETKKLYCNVWALTSGTRYDINLGKIQIESGSPATAFEPYVGGVPAPNPAFPQDVRTVNGSINFDFSGPSGVKKYTMVGKMTLADQRIIDNCGTNEQVQVSFRESKQL